MTTAPQVRYGVHGLRGLAVAIVILLHADTGLPVGGAWLGVDVFFVISGYLITAQLLRGGSLGAFYLKRAARILPAFALLIVVVAGHLVVEGSSPLRVLSAVCFVGNLALAGQIDMPLDGSASHLWSLAQEEQFYVLWPLLLLLIPLRGARLGVVICAALAAVLYLNVDARVYTFDTYYDPVLHSSPILAGCALAAFGSRADLRYVGWIGIGVLGVMIVRYDIAHHGLAVCAITLSAAAALAGAEHVHLLLTRPLQLLGTYSYGLYLWHLPMVAYFGQAGLVLSAVLAVASYHVLELPVRQAVRLRLESRSTPAGWSPKTRAREVPAS